MKTCKKCGVSKPYEEFYRAAGTKDGLRGDCKSCNAAGKAVRYRANAERDKARVRRWQRENADRVRAWQEAYRQSGKKAISNRRSYLKRKYDITLEQYDEMLAAQGGVCAICGCTPREDISLHVDHDHGTGEIRGLTCFRCNNSLGDLNDDPRRLRRAVEYLESGVESLNEAPILIALAKERVRALR